MIVTIVTVFVKNEFISDFIRATVENHNNSIKEKGNLRFDILQSMDDPAVFSLYEAYADEKASAAHKKTVHYHKWREAVAGWMEKPRIGVPHKVIAPLDAGKWR